MSNPYLTPSTAAPLTGGAAAPAPGYSAAVQQIPVFAILMMIHGGLSLACGMFYGAMAAMMPMVMQTAMQNPPGGQGGAQPPPWLFAAIYGVPALAGMIAGGFQLWGGWKAYNFQSRTLAFLAVISAFATVLTCYCSLTGIGLGVYGLILLLDSAVVEAFAMGDAGQHRSEILSRFARVIYQPQPVPLPPVQPPPAAP